MKDLHLVFVEGYTEVIFYGFCKEKWFASKSTKIINLKGNFDIDRKILDETYRYYQYYTIDKKKFKLRLSVCIDNESRNSAAPINMDVIRSELERFDITDIELFLAVQDIESWFFIDINNIFKFLSVPHADRNESKYRPVEKLNNRDLTLLFKRYGKKYRKGEAAENFIAQLDLDILHQGAAQLASFISRAK